MALYFQQGGLLLGWGCVPENRQIACHPLPVQKPALLDSLPIHSWTPLGLDICHCWVYKFKGWRIYGLGTCLTHNPQSLLWSGAAVREGKLKE